MPFQPNPDEVVLFPAPFVPTEQHQLVVSNKRVVQFAPEGNFPIADFPLDKIEFVGRMSRRPSLVPGVVALIVGVVFLIVFMAKVLPAAMYAGTPSKTETTAPRDPGDAEEELDDGIEGRDANDDDPFAEGGSEKKESTKEKLKKLKGLQKKVHFGLPDLTEDVVVGLLFLVGGVVAIFVGRSLYKKEEHLVFCRVGEIVYQMLMANSMQQTMVLSTLQAAQQANAQMKKA